MKEITPEELPKLIPDGAGIALGGFVGCGFPERLAVEIEKSFLEKGTPKDLAIFFAAGQGDAQKRGLNHLGHEGLLRFALGSHFGLAPKVGELILNEKIEAYSFPQGVPEHCQVQGMLMATLAACRGDWGAFTGLIQLDVEKPQSAPATSPLKSLPAPRAGSPRATTASGLCHGTSTAAPATRASFERPESVMLECGVVFGMSCYLRYNMRLGGIERLRINGSGIVEMFRE